MTLALDVAPPAWLLAPLAIGVLCGLVGGMLICKARRSRAAAAAETARMQCERQRMERDRIARDLYDCLLQGVQGRIWRFHTLVSRMEPGDPVRLEMESCLEAADSMLAQNRDRAQ